MAATLDDIIGMIYGSIDAAGMNAGTAASSAFGAQTGYVSPNYLPYTPGGQGRLQDLYNTYLSNYQSGTAGYGLPGSTGGSAGNLYGAIQNAAVDPSIDPDLSSWIQSQGGLGSAPTLARDQMNMADKLARDMSSAQIAASQWETQYNGQLQRDLQAGLISSQAARQASQEAHEKALQAKELSFKYAELDWTKEYGRANLGILRERLNWEMEFGQQQLGLEERRVEVQEGGLGIEQDRFALEKAIQEAMLRANPFNAVANALYTRGAETSGQLDEFGQPLDTLDGSGTLPFLQELLSSGQISDPGFQGSPLNTAGIGGNIAPNPNAFNQQSFQNLSGTERGIASSLAAYQGYDPNDYWQRMQQSWNTAGQGAINFGTRLF